MVHSCTVSRYDRAGRHSYSDRYNSIERPEWLERTILQHDIYAPTVTQLNDPADARPRIAVASDRDIARFLVRLWAAAQSSGEYRPVGRCAQGRCVGPFPRKAKRGPGQRSTEASGSVCPVLKVFSMTRHWDNLALWAKYAANHSGYCLEFANREFFSVARAVEYR